MVYKIGSTYRAVVATRVLVVLLLLLVEALHGIEQLLDTVVRVLILLPYSQAYKILMHTEML